MKLVSEIQGGRETEVRQTLLVDLTKGGRRLERCRPILQRLGQMFASDSVGLFKVRQRARDLEQSMG
ncbi:hypothetical protein D3C78_1682580 [compost metagenome]